MKCPALCCLTTLLWFRLRLYSKWKSYIRWIHAIISQLPWKCEKQSKNMLEIFKICCIILFIPALHVWVCVKMLSMHVFFSDNVAAVSLEGLKFHNHPSARSTGLEEVKNECSWQWRWHETSLKMMGKLW